MDWNKLEDECFNITLNMINDLVCKNKDDVFYALCLYTDSSAMSVSLSANSERGFSRSIHADEDDSPEMKNYYRWAFSEWHYNAYDENKFSGLSKTLRDELSKNIDLESFLNELIRILTNVLCRIRGEKIDKLDKSVFFVSITDDDNSESIENNSAKTINNSVIYREFISRYD